MAGTRECDALILGAEIPIAEDWSNTVTLRFPRRKVKDFGPLLAELSEIADSTLIWSADEGRPLRDEFPVRLLSSHFPCWARSNPGVYG